MKSTHALLVVLFFSVTSPSSVQGSKVLGLYSNQIYFLNEEQKTFDAAEDACEEKDGSLAVVKDLMDLELLAQKLFDDSSEESILRETKNISKFYWIGLQRSQKGKWSFTDGTPYRPKTQLPLTPWNSTDQSDYSCAGIVTLGLGSPSLRKQDCFHEAPFICQFEARRCVPKMVLSLTVTTNADIYVPCDPLAVQSQRQFIVNDCECSVGGVSNISTDVECNSKNWFHPGVCVPGCSIPKLPPEAVVVDPNDNYWLGDELLFMCMDGKATEKSSYLYHERWRCVEGGLWFGGNRDRFCSGPISIVNKSILKFVTEINKRVTIECNVSGQMEGIKPTSWIWFKGGEKINPSENPDYTIVGSTLSIERFAASSEGSYTCFGRFKGIKLTGNSYLISMPAEYVSSSSSSVFGFTNILGLDQRLLLGFILIVARHRRLF